MVHHDQITRPEISDVFKQQLKELGVSVIICCYNSASRISETLRHLANQNVPSGIHWEVILVDNGSTDNTQEVAQNFWIVECSSVPLKIVREEKPGLSHARERGITESRYDIIIFCDDDNLLCDTYIQRASYVMASDNRIGIAGGWCEARVQESFDDWVIPFLPALAVGKPNPESA